MPEGEPGVFTRHAGEDWNFTACLPSATRHLVLMCYRLMESISIFMVTLVAC